ncbi:preprotein translocase subunit SecE [Actinomadura meyerae]|jgi:preprotein translocase subunit SecE|uniref:Protein translocase subunit SecE n=1 Tax=Actinomadura meyerae TaxID=240840 RepID=A0A239DEQ0_9ACTN|nr:preprotein translocase subunit SecE [Actinomadura meyerae]SNS30341.1 preprotein translocase subunit SecE [Actinomadura meyerae]
MATETRDERDEPEAKDEGKSKGKKKSASRRTSPALFVRQVIAELRKVIWPTRRELVTYTTAALVFVLIMVAIVSAFDYGLQQGVYAVFG